MVVKKAAQLPLVMVAYHVPESKHPDDAALNLFDALLTRGQSSRLYKRLVDQDQLALRHNYESHSDPSLFAFSIQLERYRSSIDRKCSLYW